jgi:hypothetical protein
MRFKFHNCVLMIAYRMKLRKYRKLQYSEALPKILFHKIKNEIIGRHCPTSSTSISYSKGSGFKYQPEGRLSWIVRGCTKSFLIHYHLWSDDVWSECHGINHKLIKNQTKCKYLRWGMFRYLTLRNPNVLSVTFHRSCAGIFEGYNFPFVYFFFLPSITCIRSLVVVGRR